MIFYMINPLLYEKRPICVFEARFGGFGSTYAVHLRLIGIGKLVVDFLLVIIELFFARCFRFVTIHAFDRRMDRRTERRTAAHGKTAAAWLQRGKNGRGSFGNFKVTEAKKVACCVRP